MSFCRYHYYDYVILTLTFILFMHLRHEKDEWYLI